MIRHDYSRVDPKRRANLDYKRKQFAKAEFQQQSYEHRLNFYVLPPTAEITLEEFETWAINRLKGGSIQESLSYVLNDVGMQSSPNLNHARSATKAPRRRPNT
jgi:DNA primase large subunit